MNGLKDTAKMVRHLLANRLVWILAAIGASYWIVVPYVSVGQIVENLSLVFFIMMIGLAATYARAAFSTLSSGSTDGIAQWLAGVFLFALGNAGLAIFTYYVSISPIAMHAELYELKIRGFLHLTRLVGAALLITATASTASAMPLQKYKAAMFIAIAIAASLAAGVWVGYRSAAYHKTPVELSSVQAQPVMLASMAQSCPVLGNPRSKIFHDLNSPYRARMKVGICFASREAAAAANYRPPQR